MRDQHDAPARAPSFAGKLEDVPFPELLQFIALNRKTGKLTLTRRDGTGVVVLRSGRIIYAASNSVRETFGSILVCRGLVSEPTLMEALQKQQAAGGKKRLGAILVEMGKVTEDDLREVMHHQTGVVIQELFQWSTGFFKFEAMEIPERGEIEVDAKDFLDMEGIATDRVLLEVAARLDEQLAAEEQTAAPPGEAEPLPPEGTAEHLSPALRGEITLMLMRYAGRIVNRGVLFVVRGDQATGISHFGLGSRGSYPASAIRELTLPLAEPSVLSDVIQKKETYRGRLRSRPGDAALLRQLGGPEPTDVVIMPMILAGTVVMLFYGDNSPGGRPIGTTADLEALLTEAGLEMEKEALEARIKSFERARRRA